MTELTATEASRRFSALLDAVEETRASYVVVRKGMPVARIGPAEPSSMTAGEFLARLRQAPAVDEDYADDIDRYRAALAPLDDADPWER